MKHKYSLAVVAVAASLAIAGVAYAEDAERGDAYNSERTQKVQIMPAGSRTESAEQSGERRSATGTAMREEHASTTESDKGERASESHRSAVATFVQSLLHVADREGGIGEQVREVAHKQNDSATTTVSAMTKVEERGAIRTFFFGGDYKNLGVIRSEIATTTNNIARLKELLSKATSAADRTELTAQIQTLENEQAKVNTFVTTHENAFSLFGWFTKLFSR